MKSNKQKLTDLLKTETVGDYEKPFSIRLPKDLLQEIDKIAERTKTTKSKVIIKALRIALDTPDK